MNNNEIILQARTWLNTPFVHQGRVKNQGCDCLGLILGVGRELGVKIGTKPIEEFDEISYSMQPDGKILKKKLDEILVQKKKHEAKPGDIFLMNFGSNPQHLGFISDYPSNPAFGIIHCYSQVGKVVEHRLNDFWFSKIETIYSILN